VQTVDALRTKNPQSYVAHPKSKLLKRVLDLILIEIPRGPNAAEYQIGNTIGTAYRHWRRARFLGRFRLFFRFSSSHRVIVYAWVNDEKTLRKAGAKTDLYAVFTHRLQEGNPPDDLDDLLQSSQSMRSKDRRT